ncbi:PPP1R14B [Branchiostoma lanceolatum]|uniref:PPP1R14B protein n=1 Tax=Branchiostoma lanceolatum TaxID=7740 RepID=A0A8J9ZVJ2_BRALA|nr:PPP1R14B [Branchiostoma lanceolatum]
MNTTEAAHYSQNRSFQHSFGVEDTQVLQQYMKWEEGDAVLDAGCGTGEICKYISQQPGVASVVGFDVSPDFVSYASQHNSTQTYFITWVIPGEILLACQHDESKSYRTWWDMASHPNWKIYLKDFMPNLFPWPSSDLTNERHRSRLLEECGFEVLSCHIKEHQQPFDHGRTSQLRLSVRQPSQPKPVQPQQAPRRNVKATVKYNRALLKRRLELEEWVDEALRDIYECDEDEDYEIEIDIDEMLELQTEEERVEFLKV